jgi:acyl carrier protein
MTDKNNFLKLVANRIGGHADDLSLTDKIEDCHIDSIDLLGLILAIEDEWDILITDDEVAKFVTLGDIQTVALSKVAERTSH